MVTYSVSKPPPSTTTLSPAPHSEAPQASHSTPGVRVARSGRTLRAGLRPGVRPGFGPSLEELLRPMVSTAADAQAAPGVETINDRQVFGVFYGLRSALLVYACMALACGVAYEVWSVFGP